MPNVDDLATAISANEAADNTYWLQGRSLFSPCRQVTPSFDALLLVRAFKASLSPSP